MSGRAAIEGATSTPPLFAVRMNKESVDACSCESPSWIRQETAKVFVKEEAPVAAIKLTAEERRASVYERGIRYLASN